jgi:hypothetical protein
MSQGFLVWNLEFSNLFGIWDLGFERCQFPWDGCNRVPQPHSATGSRCIVQPCSRTAWCNCFPPPHSATAFGNRGPQTGFRWAVLPQRGFIQQPRVAFRRGFPTKGNAVGRLPWVIAKHVIHNQPQRGLDNGLRPPAQQIAPRTKPPTPSSVHPRTGSNADYVKPVASRVMPPFL